MIEAAAGNAHLRLATCSPDETIALGRRIGQSIPANLCIALCGDLGAGKTTFTKGLAAGMGIPDPVTSPTFTLVNQYATGRGAQARRLVHVDVYRLAGGRAAELNSIGFGDLLDDLEAPEADGLLVLVVEWADRLAAFLPDERLEVTGVADGEDPDTRVFTLHAVGQTARHLLHRLGEA